MSTLDRVDRIRMLELAVSSGADEFSAVAAARDFEAYVLGQDAPKRTTPEEEGFVDFPPTDKAKAN